MSKIKTPMIGCGDVGIGTHPDSPIAIEEWMRQVTNAINGLSMHTGYEPNLRVRPKMPLTNKQSAVYEYIKASVESGVTPTLRSICNHFGYNGLSSAQRHVEALVLKGVIERRGHQLIVKELSGSPMKGKE